MVTSIQFLVHIIIWLLNLYHESKHASPCFTDGLNVGTSGSSNERSKSSDEMLLALGVDFWKLLYWEGESTLCCVLGKLFGDISLETLWGELWGDCCGVIFCSDNDVGAFVGKCKSKMMSSFLSWYLYYKYYNHVFHFKKTSKCFDKTYIS